MWAISSPGVRSPWLSMYMYSVPVKLVLVERLRDQWPDCSANCFLKIQKIIKFNEIKVNRL